MPKMDGKAAFRELRIIKPEIDVLILSGFAVYGEAQTLLDEGARDFIQKPFGKANLAAKLADIFCQ